LIMSLHVAIVMNGAGGNLHYFLHGEIFLKWTRSGENENSINITRMEN